MDHNDEHGGSVHEHHRNGHVQASQSMCVMGYNSLEVSVFFPSLSCASVLSHVAVDLHHQSGTLTCQHRQSPGTCLGAPLYLGPVPIPHGALVPGTLCTVYLDHRTALVGGCYGYQVLWRLKALGRLADGHSERDLVTGGPPGYPRSESVYHGCRKKDASRRAGSRTGERTASLVA